MVTHQLQVRCRPVKVRRSETDVLPLSHPTNHGTEEKTVKCKTIDTEKTTTTEKVPYTDMAEFMQKRHFLFPLIIMPEVCLDCRKRLDIFVYLLCLFSYDQHDVSGYWPPDIVTVICRNVANKWTIQLKKFFYWFTNSNIKNSPNFIVI